MSLQFEPSVQPPAGAAVSDWVDLNYPTDAYRTFSGPARGFERGECDRRGQYVHAGGLQNLDGTLEDVSVHADLDVWDVGSYHHVWDDALTPADARGWAHRLVSDAHKMLTLADAFMQAADEVDGWVTR